MEYSIEVSASTYSSLLLFLTRSPAAEADLELRELVIDLELLILLPLPLEFWDCRCVPPHQVLGSAGNGTQGLGCYSHIRYGFSYVPTL